MNCSLRLRAGHRLWVQFTAGYGPDRPYMAGVAANRRLTAAAHFQDVRHIELDLGDSGIAYEPGDLLAIMPRQPGAAVRALLQRLGLEPDALVAVCRAGPTVSGAPGQEISPVRPNKYRPFAFIFLCSLSKFRKLQRSMPIPAHLHLALHIECLSGIDINTDICPGQQLLSAMCSRPRPESTDS